MHPKVNVRRHYAGGRIHYSHSIPGGGILRQVNLNGKRMVMPVYKGKGIKNPAGAGVQHHHHMAKAKVGGIIAQPKQDNLLSAIHQAFHRRGIR